MLVLQGVVGVDDGVSKRALDLQQVCSDFWDLFEGGLERLVVADSFILVDVCKREDTIFSIKLRDTLMSQGYGGVKSGLDKQHSRRIEIIYILNK